MLLNLLLSLLLLQSPVLADRAEELACSTATLDYLCQHYEICSRYGLMDEAAREMLCGSSDDQMMWSSAPATAPTSADAAVETVAATEPWDATSSTNDNRVETITGGIVTRETYTIGSSGPITRSRVTYPPASTEPRREALSTGGSTPTIDNWEPTQPSSESAAVQGTPPVISQLPVNVTVAPGGTGEFSCTAEGAPTPQTTITKREETSRPDLDAFAHAISTELQSQTTINSIANVDYPNEGWYTCQACNRYGCAEHDAYLHVLDLCAEVSCPGDKKCRGDYEAGEGYTCECPSYCKAEELFKFDIVCSNYCEVRFNECEMYTDACENDKFGVALLNTGTCAPQQSPVFVEGLTEVNLELMEGDSLTLECDATGLPTPEIIWLKGGELVGDEMVGGALVGTGHTLTKLMTLEDTGTYTCQAMNCKSTSIFHVSAVVHVTPTPTIPPPTYSPVEPDNIVIENPRSTCAVYGDPHFETFDGSKFDYMGKCDSVLAMDCEYGSWFVYGRMRACGLSGGSCLEAVTVYVQDEVLELQRGWLVNRNGEKIVPKNRPNREILIEGPHVTFSLYFDGRILRLSTVLEEVTEYGVTSTEDLVLLWDGYVSLEIQAPRSARTCGICGNNDGDSTNDMQMRRGGTAPSPTALGESWNVGRRCEEAAEPRTTEEVCGDGLEAAQLECARIFNATAFEQCEAMGHEKDAYLRACVYDKCSGLMGSNSLPPSCIAAQAYSTRCANYHWFGLDTSPVVYPQAENWFSEVGCPSPEEMLQPILDTGCPQSSLAQETGSEIV